MEECKKQINKKYTILYYNNSNNIEKNKNKKKTEQKLSSTQKLKLTNLLRRRFRSRS
jgi:hypothetical protein